MIKKYQIKGSKTNDELELAVSNVAMNEIAADIREGLLAVAPALGCR